MPRVGLDRSRVVAAAASLADGRGLAQLSLAAVAQELGVKTPSLYNHVAGLDALQHEVCLLALEELTARLSAAAVGRSGAEALQALGSAYRAYALEHPGRYAATLRSPDAQDEVLADVAGRVLTVVTDALRGYGLAGDDEVDAVRALRAALHGWVSLEQAGGFGLPRDVEQSFHRMLDRLDTSLRRAG
ncbi:TetR/AcrR family transcriptional regulator [Sinomonas mesophila]|uniref:TetR/AcrR family transcriptional regulator n=1 Tax=Sinomonas mesophila TaxID=1531955 RepID=UPI000985E66E|nr:TetR/AcrR family transcriptional regulator [Sinomonas mesophila]